MKRIVLAVSGASGMPYALRLAQAMAQTGEVEINLVVSRAARRVLELECAPGAENALLAAAQALYDQDDIAAPPASGSWPHQGMVVCPCSMSTLAHVARGVGENLIHRAADVTLKEGRKLVLVPRETPLSTIHLENMLAAKRAGATILPACPGFYAGAARLEDLVDFVVARIMDQLDISHDLIRPWNPEQGGDNAP